MSLVPRSGRVPRRRAAAGLMLTPADEFRQDAVNPCFAAGTHILTELGEVLVEELAIGDIVILADGETAAVTWLGKREVDFSRHPRPAAAWPVRIQAGALAMGVPERDLVVSPDHGLYFDGSLVQAKDLIDGITMRQESNIAKIRYHHVGLAEHGILLAEGAPAESYLDCGHRAVFDEARPPIILPAHPQALRGTVPSAAPLITGGEALAAIRTRLHARKLMLGYMVGVAGWPQLESVSISLAPTKAADWAYFDVPAGLAAARLTTPVFIPAEIDPASPDRRVLGLGMTEAMLNGRFVELESIFELSDLYRSAPGETVTWTRGPARMRLPAQTVSLALKIAVLPKRWQRHA